VCFSARACLSAALLASALLASPSFAQTRPASAADIDIPLSDARDIEPNAVRFGAQQHSGAAPAIVIFGVTKANWPKLRAAIQQAVFEGYPVAGIFIGPASPSALEIYAKGQHVSVDGIDPNTITGPELTRLIRDVSRQYYR
jgi:ABC-type sugar transport system substrate-binding protein